MTETIELSSALRRLPLEAPPHSVWPAVQAQLPKRPAWPTWPTAAAAAAVLLAALCQFTGQPPATGTSAGASVFWMSSISRRRCGEGQRPLGR